MGTRPLRQHYDEVDRFVVDEALGRVIEPWRRHRRRLLATVTTFDDAQWLAPTRCAGWNARDVISHLIGVDQFFVLSLLGAQAGTPTQVLPGFDPQAVPEMLVDPMRAVPVDELLERFAAGLEVFEQTVDGFAPADWDRRGESPLGWVPARLVLAHAFWDSWVHELDILVPRGSAPELMDDELFTATWYCVLVGCAQGGLLEDADPVGPGPDAPVQAELAFRELPDRALGVRVDQGVRLWCDQGEASSSPIGAMALIDAFGGRGGALDALPADLRAQLERGRQIL